MIPLISFENAGKVWERIKIVSPHVGFILILIVYLCIGSIIFGLIEKPNAKKSESENRSLVAKKQRELLSKIDGLKMDRRTFNEAQKEFDYFVREMYKIYKKNGSKFLNSINNDGDDSWNFMQAFFFGLTTILSIGYGADVPVTFQGRIFCLIFVVIGLPLTMVTLANVAKFLSQLITWIYTCSLIKLSKFSVRFYKILDRVSRSSRHSKFITRIRRNSNSCDEKMAQLLWDNLDQASVVRVPIWLMFALILLYICLGALTFGPSENWSFAEGFYFSFVSVFAVGFGDLTPKNPAHLWWACFYVLGGLVLATTCVDAVGVHYANELHNAGRRLKRTNPIGWLKIMQEKRLRAMKRQAAWNLFQIVAAVSQIKEEKEIDEYEMSENDNSNYSLQVPLLDKKDMKIMQGPPSEVRNFRAESATASNVQLFWDAPLYGSTDGLHYVLSYRLSPLSSDAIFTNPQFMQWWTLFNELPLGVYPAQNVKIYTWRPSLLTKFDFPWMDAKSNSFHRTRRAALTVIEPIYKTGYNVIELSSFSLYHFTVVAVNSAGRSPAVYVQEYTEPSTVPLNLRAELIEPRILLLTWDAPMKNREGMKHYIVHQAFNNGKKPSKEWICYDVGEMKQCLINDLKPNFEYCFSVSANHNAGLAIFSKCLDYFLRDEIY